MLSKSNINLKNAEESIGWNILLKNNYSNISFVCSIKIFIAFNCENH